MNTEKSIKFLEDFKTKLRLRSDEIVEFNNIIGSLRRGEKFEFIFSDMHSLIQHLLDGTFFYGIKTDVMTDAEYMAKAFEIIEEEYFPKKENPFEGMLEKILWKTMKEFIENSSELILKCMEKAKKNERGK